MTAASVLDDLIRRVARLDEKEQAKLDSRISDKLSECWLPNPGPQTTAYLSLADETFYGGQAGGGKTDLAVGLAITRHKRSLILRRINKDAVKIVTRVEDILGHRNGYNGQLQRWKLDDKLIEFAGCEQEADKQRFKGDPHDLIVFDEGTDFLESQYRFIIGWNRSADKNQRCRVLVTSNPPTTAEGRWVIRYWAPWLDKTHPNPAKPGELRWFTTIDGKDVEVDGPGPHEIEGEDHPVIARSRTFIPASLDDNPDLAETNYDAVLAGLPDELRRAYRDGDFSVGLKDSDYQVIPTKWARDAMARWTPEPPQGVGMSCLSIDPSLGGEDDCVFSRRHGHWFDKLVAVPGKEISDPIETAAKAITLMRDGCPIVVDVIGVGSGAFSHLKNNVAGIKVIGINVANASTKRTRDGKLKFANKRAELLWRLREALEPNLGEPIALPPDEELLADLTAARWKLTSSGILIESKDDIRKRIGRSTGRSDAVMMAWSEGESSVSARIRVAANPTGRPVVNLGHAALKRRR